MILRRLTEHVRTQNWFAVALDFLIVVLGVFVAAQVTNWNETRNDQQRANAYAERLLEDLKFNAWQVDYMIAYNGEVLKHAGLAAGALTGDAPLSDEDLLVSAYRASQYLYYGTRRSTYDEMVATGDIGLLADRLLRETALVFYSDPTVATTTEEGRTSEYRQAFRRAVPATVQRALLRDCGDIVIDPGDYEGIYGSIDYPCTLELSATVIADSAARLRALPELLSALQLRFGDIETAILNLEQGTPGLLEDLRALAERDSP
jgi:Family of unknown function (DUF6090)